MVELFSKSKSNFSQINDSEITNNSYEQQLVFTGALLESLREIKQKLDVLEYKISILERTFDTKIPDKILTEKKFEQEIETSDEIINRIISEVKSAAHPLIASRDQLTLVEQKRIEKVISILQEHGKLSSVQLAQVMNLSRTRCNEYFKQMEDLGLVEGIDLGKERYYKIKE